MGLDEGDSVGLCETVVLGLENDVEGLKLGLSVTDEKGLEKGLIVGDRTGLLDGCIVG